METTTIKERPILFSGPMVRAILEGRKTQTRRIVKGSGSWAVVTEERGVLWPGFENELGDWQNFECPYGQPGNYLWMREAWARIVVGNQIDYLYRADTHTGLEKRDGDQKWKPSIHMPRIACRLMLEITGVRVERLNDISHHDALQEGLIEWSDPPRVSTLHYGVSRADCWETSSVMAYKRLWESINGDGSWAANPWVWVVEFKRVK